MKKLKKILLVAATEAEIAPFLAKARLTPIGYYQHTYHIGTFADHHLSVLITGAGILSTAFALGNLLSRDHFDVVLHAGIAGSFSEQYPIGSVVQIVTDSLGDAGAEDHEQFIPLSQLPFFDANAFPFQNGQLHNPQPQTFAVAAALPQVSGITVNAVSGCERTIALRKNIFAADIETMESAALFYACLWHDIPFCSLRSISNIITPRNTAEWQIPLAIERLEECLVRCLED
ncbi:MAG: futalosine hydrolase [Chitinophagales bacterium]|nr:futalosine hydrolase [Chitinophagales bacterium]